MMGSFVVHNLTEFIGRYYQFFITLQETKPFQRALQCEK